MIKQIKINKSYLMVGGNWKSFSVGFTIDKYGISVNLGFFWIAIEL
jgi:hypothetical protein